MSKQKPSRRILAMMLSIMLVLGIAPMTAMADEPELPAQPYNGFVKRTSYTEAEIMFSIDWAGGTPYYLVGEPAADAPAAGEDFDADGWTELFTVDIGTHFRKIALTEGAKTVYVVVVNDSGVASAALPISVRAGFLKNPLPTIEVYKWGVTNIQGEFLLKGDRIGSGFEILTQPDSDIAMAQTQGEDLVISGLKVGETEIKLGFYGLEVTVPIVVSEPPAEFIPVLSGGEAERTSHTAAIINFATNMDGLAYYAVREQSAGAPVLPDDTGEFTLIRASILAGYATISVPLTAGAKDVYVLFVEDTHSLPSNILKIEVPAYALPAGTIDITELESAAAISTEIGTELAKENVTTVTVVGTKSGLSDGLSLNIPAGKMVVWQADYSGSGQFSISGAGSLEIAEGGKMLNTAGHALFVFNTVAVTVNGEVKGHINGYATVLFANATMTVGTGGLVENTHSSGIAVGSTSKDATLIVDGGTVKGARTIAVGCRVFIKDGLVENTSSGNYAIDMSESGALSISGGTIKNTTKPTNAVRISANSTLFVSGGVVVDGGITRDGSAVACYVGDHSAKFGDSFTKDTDLFALNKVQSITAGGTAHDGTTPTHRVVAHLSDKLDLSAATVTASLGNPSVDKTAKTLTFTENTSGKQSTTVTTSGAKVADVGIEIPDFTTESFDININKVLGGMAGVTGTAEVGQELTADVASLTPAADDGRPELTYQWQYSANGSDGWANIPGATAESYTVALEYSNKYLRVVVSPIAASGFTGTVASSSSQIAKANYPPIIAPSISIYRQTATTGNTVDLAGLLPEAERDAASYNITSSNTLVTNASVDSSGELTFGTTASDSAASEDITVEVTMENYQPSTITLTVNFVDRKVPVVTPIVSGSLSYGQPLSALAISATALVGEDENVPGSIVWHDPSSKPVAGAPAQGWTFTPENTVVYEVITGVSPITVNKATPSGTPSITSITQSGKTLAGANLTGSFTNPYDASEVSGTLAWDGEDSTAVVANTAYGWTFMPDDTANYNSRAGSFTPYSRSSGGDSGGGSYTPPASPATPAPQWLEQSGTSQAIADAKEQGNNQILTRANGQYGIRQATWAAFAGHQFWHDTMDGGAVQVRTYIKNPTALTTDLLVSGYVKGSGVEQTKALFEKYFGNQVRTIHLDQTGAWGQTVELAAKVDLTGMDITKLYIYSYDKATNTYRRIVNPAYWVDTNGYLHFNTALAGDIIISEGPLARIENGGAK